MIRHLFILIALCVISFPVQAKEKLSVAEWSSLPVLHQGRIKPLDSFARIYLKTFSGKDKIEGMKAAEWLAETVFNPADAITTPLFRHSEGGGSKSRIISYEETAKIIRDKETSIQALLKQPENTWSTDQKNLMTLHENFILYTQILRSLTLLLPLSGGETPKNFIDYKKIQSELNQKIKNIVKRKGTDLNKYTEEEKEIAALSFQLNIMESSGQNNVLFRIIPTAQGWLSPWEAAQIAEDKEIVPLNTWQKMALAYRLQDSTEWHKAVDEAKNIAGEATSPLKLSIEKIYNILSLIGLALMFYCAGLLAIIVGNLTNLKKLERLSFIIFANGIIFHTAHILLRIYILERPPVGTLYESLLFVSLVSAAGFLWMAWKQKTQTGIMLGSLSGVILLATATAFSAEDNMGTLVAVLNTNFWLATHVLCITIGYGVCLITSLCAHYYLVQKILNRENGQLLKNIKTLAILSLLFTTVGTVLGGLWADQSWGRFWGWDPKENGALLIVLWLVWLLHGRISKHVNDTAFVAGMAALSIIVVLAWLGVNLLSVGLHSYGFISGVAWGIGIFCTAELAIIGTLWSLQRRGLSS